MHITLPSEETVATFTDVAVYAPLIALIIAATVRTFGLAIYGGTYTQCAVCLTVWLAAYAYRYMTGGAR